MTYHENDLLTVEELMVYLKIGRTKAYQIIHSDGFPAIRISNFYRIPYSKLINWLYSENIDN